jgi:hypothetical protein
MKALIQILFSSSIQRLPKADGARIGTQVQVRPIGARMPTMLFPMSLTLEGYHVYGGQSLSSLGGGWATTGRPAAIAEYFCSN